MHERLSTAWRLVGWSGGSGMPLLAWSAAGGQGRRVAWRVAPGAAARGAGEEGWGGDNRFRGIGAADMIPTTSLIGRLIYQAIERFVDKLLHSYRDLSTYC